ncbi:hypothetical protein [uncultured Tenacibaculum sp.]|uniref:hypothetical protein n=1 Tax=uncultured Tenacibaculum sp. TaxID=174713 RepID=UPI002621253B|nr:hypothetical protein [uncultured Tenacibaculum sp.]
MKKSILQLGRIIPKNQQQLIHGGDSREGCEYGTYPEGYTCYNGGGENFCSDEDQGLNTFALSKPKIETPKIKKSGPRYGTDM